MLIRSLTALAAVSGLALQDPGKDPQVITHIDATPLPVIRVPAVPDGFLSGIEMVPNDDAPAQPVPRVESSGAIPAFLMRGLDWLVEAQHENGGWGAGSHANQQEKNPHGVVTDPGTSAFAALALLRSGHTPTSGRFKHSVQAATNYLLGIVESAPEDGPRITDVTGTQPQAKMGQFVDTALCAQFLSRLLPEIDGDPELKNRVTAALDKCLRKVEATQSANGSWANGGWAPVLQSGLMTNALELGRAAGREIDVTRLEKAREYQQAQINVATGEIATDSAAGIALYSVSSNLRSSSADAKAAKDAIEEAKREGRLDADAEINEDNLRKAGVAAPEAARLNTAVAQNEAAVTQALDDTVLSGFGNNGGEEYLSYMMNSESLVIEGGDNWVHWRDKMTTRLAKVQNGDGSWSGHHCITSPVFCTSAVILCLTAERDADILGQATDVALDSVK